MPAELFTEQFEENVFHLNLPNSMNSLLINVSADMSSEKWGEYAVVITILRLFTIISIDKLSIKQVLVKGSKICFMFII